MGVLGKCCSEGLKISKTRLEDGVENSEKLSTVKKKKAKDKDSYPMNLTKFLSVFFICLIGLFNSKS